MNPALLSGIVGVLVGYGDWCAVILFGLRGLGGILDASVGIAAM